MRSGRLQQVKRLKHLHSTLIGGMKAKTETSGNDGYGVSAQSVT
jgi:hypothetical protein